jgi:1-acyl-sn-glycerol-3-phosphate acyltransferase
VAEVAPRDERTVWWRIGLAVVGAVFRLGFRIRTVGIERVPDRGAAILAGNHVSAIDGVFLALLVGRLRKRMTRFLVAAEFFDTVRLGWALKLYRQIPLRRGAGDSRAIDEAERTIRSGALAGIFPEGRVNPNPEAGLQRGGRGIARIALAARVPVIPVGIWGPQTRWPRDGFTLRRPFRPTVVLSFGDPIRPHADAPSREDLQVFTEAIMRHIEKQVEQARALAERAR